MKKLFLILILWMVVLVARAQPQIPRIEWKHYSNENGDLDIPNGGIYQTSCVIFDVDKDGINDFIIAEQTKSPSLVWYKNKNDHWSRHVMDNEQLPIGVGETYFDIDHDGDTDALFAGNYASNQIWWWENPYPDFDPGVPWKRHTIKTTGAVQQHDQIFGDFDGDGNVELVFWNQGATTLFMAEIPDDPRNTDQWDFYPIYSYSSDSQMEPPGKLEGGGNAHEGLAKADIDQDSIMDIIGGGRWFKYLGDHNFQCNIIDASYGYSRCGVGQLIEGGRPEVVLVGGDGIGPMIMYEWQKGTWVPTTLIPRVDHGHSLELVDFNGDGHLDIFNAEMRFSETQNPGAVCRILLSDGKGHFTDYIINQGYSNHESKIGDLDGDGDYDVVSKPFKYRAPGIDIWLQNGTSGKRK